MHPILVDLHVYPARHKSGMAPHSRIDLDPKLLVVLPGGHDLHCLLLAVGEYLPGLHSSQPFAIPYPGLHMQSA